MNPIDANVAPLLLRACAQCARGNRIPLARLGEAARCGACGHSLPPEGRPIEVGEQLFDAIVSAAQVPVLVDFWAPDAGPSRLTATEVFEAARRLCGRAIVLKVNAEENGALLARYAIRVLPHFAVFREGQLVNVQPGLLGRRDLEKLALGALH